jgi:uncharacterized membrane protein
MDEALRQLFGSDWLYVAVLSMLPWVELRGGIPYGILKAGYNPIIVTVVSVLANCLVIYPGFVFLDHFFRKVDRWVLHGLIEKTRAKAKPYVEKYGMPGLAVFVAVPLPGTGAYAGTLAAYLFGMNHRQAFASISAGVAAAGAIVFVVTLFFRESLGFLIKMV